jgi:competence protein ComEA
MYLSWRVGRVNLNDATEQDLIRVVELPPAAAAAILDYRTLEGRFQSLDDLRKVPGLDLRALEGRADRLIIAGK